MAYGTLRFIAAFTRALQYSLSWTESTQFLVLTYFFNVHYDIVVPVDLIKTLMDLTYHDHVLLPYSNWLQSLVFRCGSKGNGKP